MDKTLSALLFSLKGGRPFETPKLGIQLPGKARTRTATPAPSGDGLP